MKEIEEKFMTQGKFTSLVEDRVKESNGLINYIEGVASVCEEFEIEVERNESLAGLVIRLLSGGWLLQYCRAVSLTDE